MDSDFFSEGFAEKKELEHIAARISELRAEMNGAQDHSTGRSHALIQKEIEELEKKRDLLHLALEKYEAES